MKPELVLTAPEKSTRFRKCLKRLLRSNKCVQKKKGGTASGNTSEKDNTMYKKYLNPDRTGTGKKRISLEILRNYFTS